MILLFRVTSLPCRTPPRDSAASSVILLPPREPPFAIDDLAISLWYSYLSVLQCLLSDTGVVKIAPPPNKRAPLFQTLRPPPVRLDPSLPAAPSLCLSALSQPTVLEQPQLFSLLAVLDHRIQGRAKLLAGPESASRSSQPPCVPPRSSSNPSTSQSIQP